jgi:ubiquinone/menaquinone biosynthesis C-methylase UbiE
MYIKTLERKRAVLIETKRVLKSDGVLYLWDATIQEKPDLSVVFVEVILPNEEKIYTGYGVKGKKEKEQTLELISKLALEAGFKITRTESHKNWFTICSH